MTRFFACGKSGDQYPGVAVNSVTHLATQIHDVLVNQAGWELFSGSPTALPMRIRSSLAIGGIRALFEFNSTSNGLSVQAVDGSTLAPPIGTSTGQLAPWIVSSTSRSWIVASARSWIISVTSAGERVTIYGGWGWWPKQFEVPGTSWVLARLCHTFISPFTTTTSGFQGVVYRSASGIRFAPLPVGWNHSVLHGGDPSSTATINARTIAPELTENYHRSREGEFNGYVEFAVCGLGRLTSGAIYRVNTGTEIRVYMACGGYEAGFMVDAYPPPT